MVDDAETQKLLHSPWSNAETQKMLHSPWSTMLKHRGSRYTVRGQQQLTQIDYNSCTVSQASTIAAA
jgi:hypothetical protein